MMKSWGPVAGWMAVIFFFSGDNFYGANTASWLEPLLAALFPALSAAQFAAIHLTLRKLGHWSEYFILASLLLRAVRREFPKRSPIVRGLWCIVIATIYAASDEWHQAFVPSRSASLADVMIDSFGAICGAIFSRWTGELK
ncbi:MAG: VanZ family protein [Deltaproteobacteria bacterium]|nr:VanZ family protein [Deltaproteobacteria bacterium]